MARKSKPPAQPEPGGPAAGLPLVPRFTAQGYSPDDVRLRREWIERQTAAALPTVGSCSIPTEAMRGNIENPIGSVQMPLGIAGPLLVHGEHARGMFYVPMATTEGALVRSYERGMVMLTRAGGVTARVFVDENVVSPAFAFDSVADAHRFAAELPGHFDALRAEAESTTRHGRLVRVQPRPSGRSVIVNFYYDTADAQGMNMIVKATDHACRWLVAQGAAPRFTVFSGMSSEKRASGFLLAGGKGKTVVAGARIPAAVLAGVHAHHASRRLPPSGTTPCSATSRRARSATTATMPTAWPPSSSPAARTWPTSRTPPSASPTTKSPTKAICTRASRCRR